MISLVPLSLRFDPGSPHPSAPLTPSPLGKATLVVTFDVALRSFGCFTPSRMTRADEPCFARCDIFAYGKCDILTCDILSCDMFAPLTWFAHQASTQVLGVIDKQIEQ